MLDVCNSHNDDTDNDSVDDNTDNDTGDELDVKTILMTSNNYWLTEVSGMYIVLAGTTQVVCLYCGFCGMGDITALFLYLGMGVVTMFNVASLCTFSVVLSWNRPSFL